MIQERSTALRTIVGGTDIPHDLPRVGAYLVDPDSVALPSEPYDILANEYGLYSMPRAFEKREVPRVLAAGEVYEPNTLKFMQRMVDRGDIISGGAFVGDFFPALSRSLTRGAVLHSFEPNPVSYAAALHTISLNALRNVSLAPMGVGEEAGQLSLLVSRGKNDAPLAAGARLVKDAAADQTTIDVQVTTIDALIPENRNVSILHLDIEGHEMQALLGAMDVINRCRPILILEGAGPKAIRKYNRFLRNRFPDLAYRQAGRVEHNAIFVCDPV